MRPHLIAILIPLLLGACASESKSPSATVSKSGRECFFVSSVNSFEPVSDQLVNIRVGVNDVYQLTLFAPCNDIDWVNSIGLATRVGNTICTGRDDSEIVSRGPSGPRRCQVQSVRKLAPDEVAVLPKTQKP